MVVDTSGRVNTLQMNVYELQSQLGEANKRIAELITNQRELRDALTARGIYSKSDHRYTRES